MKAELYNKNLRIVDIALRDFDLDHRLGERGVISLMLAAQQAQKAVQNSERISVFFVIFVVVIAAGIGTAITRSISRPLTGLTQHIKLFRLDDIGQKISVPGGNMNYPGSHLLARWFPGLFKNETVELANSFNQMSEWLEETVVSRDYVDNILESVTDGIITINAEGKVQTYNAGAEKIFGYSSKEIIGKNVSGLLPRSERKEHEAYTAQSQLHEPRIINQNPDLTGCRKDGSLFPMELIVAPMVVEGARGYVGTMRDITQRMEVDRAKAKFVSTVSHELRTPLTSIKGALGLIKHGAAGELPDKLQSMLNIAYNNSDRLVLLINDILDMEKMNAVKMDFHMEPMEVISLIDEAIEANKGYGDEHNVSFVRTGLDQPVLLQGDKDRLMQVLSNLMSNAAKFSPDGDQVDLSIMRKEDSIRVAVKDNGSGVPKEFHDKIFDKFSQADSSDTRQKAGTGLGLSITKAIIEYHGGTINFDTETGKGSTFFFDIPELAQQ